MKMLIGQQIDDFRIEKFIARGGMGDVYLARHLGSDRLVCLKVMFEWRTENREAVLRFHREAEAIAQLRHPHIIRILGKGLTPNQQPYLVMPYLPGGSLDVAYERRQQSGQPMQPVEILQICTAVAEALEAIHRAGMVHRDLKPANILLKADDTPVVADLGIVSMLQATRLTRTGRIPGTLYYMAPEQLRGQPVDGRTDIYALGVILYELLAGARPFEAIEERALVQQHLQMNPQPLAQKRPGLSPATYRLVHTCLQKDPARRYQTAAAAALALEQAARSEASGRWRQPPLAWLARPLSREIPWPYLAVAGVVGALLLFYLLTSRAGDVTIARAGPTRVPTMTPTAVPTFTPPPAVVNALAAETAVPTPTHTPAAAETAVAESPTPTETTLSSPTPFFTPLPSATAILDDGRVTPTVGGRAAGLVETSLASGPCLPDVDPRWQATLYARYAGDLGCALTPVRQPEAAFQIFDKGLMLWRGDWDLVYILYYHDGTFAVYDVSQISPTYDNDHPDLKGAFGYLWNTDDTIRERLLNPVFPEANPTHFAIQDFSGGTIFYFLENNANNYVLLENSALWFAAQE